jgi:hypothetical protein
MSKARARVGAKQELRGSRVRAAKVQLPVEYMSAEEWAPVTLLCPLARHVMVDAVVGGDGVTYERDYLERWHLEHGRRGSPCLADFDAGEEIVEEDELLGGLPTDTAMQEKIAAWHQERTWRIDASALEVCEQDVLGKGAWGVVKRGKLARSGGGEAEEVALKMWPHAHAALAERLCAHESAVYKAAAGCRRTCVMHGTSTLKGRGVLVLRYYRTSLLDKLLACVGQCLPGGLLLRCAADLFEGLASLHSRRILVRDLNIQNLLLDDNERLVIVDLGVAQVLAPHQTSIQPDEVLGTANYLPPEALSALNTSTPASSAVASPLHLSLRSDVWCAAACILHMASGKRPFDGMSWTQVAAHVCSRRAVPPLPSQMHGPLRDILMQCFAWNAQDRPAASAAYDLCRSLLAPSPSPALLSVNSSVTQEEKIVEPLIAF